MIVTGATREQMGAALNRINLVYGDNITFRSIEQISKNRIRFTLTVNDSRGLGSRISASAFQNGRRVKAACWHVHGDFFDTLFQIAPAAIVLSAGMRISEDEGNWKDWNIGSEMYPVYSSQACDCRYGR